LFREALLNLGNEAKLDYLKGQFELKPINYVSPRPFPPSKDWVVGFTEAEGSFYITVKDGRALPHPRLVHGFGVTQKLDKHILAFLRSLLGIAAAIKPTGPGGNA
jgi:hypothetical protein